MVVIEQDVFTTPLYTQAEAAAIVGVPSNTLRNWAHGYAYKTISERVVTKDPLVTLAPEHQRLRVPFIGLAEAHVLNVLRRSGIPMVRIRPAVERLKEGMGVSFALLTDRLQTDGVEVLYDYVGEDAEAEGGRMGLAVVRDKQLVFREAIEQYLRSVTYEGGFITSFEPSTYEAGVVRVDPRLNSGQPSFVRSGVRVEDVLRRIRAGEPLDEVADDYGIEPVDVRLVASRV